MRCIRALALLLILISYGCGGTPEPAVAGSSRTPPVPAAAPAVAASPIPPGPRTEAPTVIAVHYFHGNARCATCRRIEELTLKSLEGELAEMVFDGRIQFRVLNVEESGNEHFVEDFQLFTRSVVVAREKAGKIESWERLDKVWQLVHDESAFVAYLQAAIRQKLGEAS